MTLLARQTAFCAEIVAGDDAAPPSSIGMAIYRDAYRGRLLGALEVSFERTRQWVGADAFTTAACHYVLTHPPSDWTLDGYGAHFPGILAELFAGDPEVAELAWFEWHIQQAFAAPDRPVLNSAALMAAGYGEADWEHVRFAMTAGFVMRAVATDCLSLWTGLAEDEDGPIVVEPAIDSVLAVWRKNFRPTYRLFDKTEAAALERLAAGATFGAVAADCDGEKLGAWLARWLDDGMFSASSCARMPAMG